MNAKSKIVFGFVAGFALAATAICGELLRWFNCINAWLIGVCIFTLLLSLFSGKHRVSFVAVATLTAYLFVIPYTIVHDVIQNRWDASDSLPMFFVIFLFLVCVPVAFSVLFGRLFDFTRQYPHSKAPTSL